jgi:Cdc6-like AAA superfamily ATPase
MSLTDEQKNSLKIKAAELFSPRTPIATHDLFAGRFSQISKVMATIAQTGAHAIIYGERGVGKTSLANVAPIMRHIQDKVPLEKIASIRINCDGTDSYDALWKKVFGAIRLSDEDVLMGFIPNIEVTYHPLLNDIEEDVLTPGIVQRVLADVSSNCELVITLDEFDRLPSGEVPRLIADTIKSLSDNLVSATIIVVGVGDSIAQLVQGHESVGRHLVEVPLPRMSRDELEKIVNDRLPQLHLGIDHNALRFISLVSAGLPYFTHLLGQHAVCEATDHDSDHITRDHVDAAMKKAIADSERGMKTAYYDATRSRHPKSQFATTLAACALAQHDDFGYFTAANVRDTLSAIRGVAKEIGTFAVHLERFCDVKRGAILQSTGEKHQMRYRFHNPLMQPFVLIRSLDAHIIKAEHIRALTK